MQRWNVLQSQQFDIVLTSEELRLAALSASAKRGKWVARRRLFRRWLMWVTWTFVLPVIGLVAVIASLLGLAFWQYTGHDVAYAAAQKWVQQEFGSFQTNSNNNIPPVRPDNASMINLTVEATPDLLLDHHLTIKPPLNQNSQNQNQKGQQP
jgi:hypothetical protein